MPDTETALQSTPDDLLSPVESSTTHVNGHCVIYEVEGIRSVFVSGVPVDRIATGNQEEEDLFIARAQEHGWATAVELARALGRAFRTVRRIHQRYKEGGVGGVQLKKRGPKGPRMGKAKETAVRRMREKGLSYRRIAERVGGSHVAVWDAARRMGLRGENVQSELFPREEDVSSETGSEAAPEGRPMESACREDEEPAMVPGKGDKPEEPSGDLDPKEPFKESEGVEEVPLALKHADKSPSEALLEEPRPSLDTDPADRSMDRRMAMEGTLTDARPLFASGQRISRVGVLLAMPMLVQSGLLQEARALYSDRKPAFYGIQTMLVLVIFLTLLRIRRPENIKEYSPVELGRLLGLDRAPEVKTLRRRLQEMAEGPAETLLEKLALRRVKNRSEAMGFFYIDGHVRVYTGKERLPKAHVARMRLSMPAIQDVWVNDATGDPVFFLTQEAHPSLVKALDPVMKEVKKLMGPNRRVTFVFDRGGWSPALFKRMSKDDFDVLTYRKGTIEPVLENYFSTYKVPGEKEPWSLAEVSVWVGGPEDGLWMRQVTRQKGDHQTQILTTRQDLSIIETAQRMFDRWRQENFFKYMRAEFAMDALAEYGAEDGDQSREMPNPAWAAVNWVLKRAKAKLRSLQADHGAASLGGLGDIPDADRIGAIQQASDQVEALLARRKALPKRVKVEDIPVADQPRRLPTQRKRLMDGLKMLAWQVETDLVRSLPSTFARKDDEGRKLVAAALASSGDLEITPDEIRVTLSPQSSPNRTRAIHELCGLLNMTETRFPGTAQRLRYAIHDPSVAT